jgi:acetyl-CoA carboxylase carboxyl transferase subunit alpha
MADDNTYNGTYQLEFEKPLIELEAQIVALEQGKGESAVNIDSELKSLRDNHTAMLKKTYARLSPWQVVQVSRHPGRPQASDYIRHIVKDFAELHGDRRFGDDPAIITGFGRIAQYKCLVVAHNKGKGHQGEDRLPTSAAPIRRATARRWRR